MDNGNQYKGNLHYVAEFVPALALRGVEFKSEPNELLQAAEGGGSDSETVENESIASADPISIPHGITTSRPLGVDEEPEEVPKHLKNTTDATVTTDTAATNRSRDPSPTAETKMEKEEVGVSMTKEELLSQRMDRLIPKAAS